jgi:hypothetical protein
VRRVSGLLAAAAPVAVGMAFVVGCGAGSGTAGNATAAPRGDLTLDEARAVDEFPLFYAGEQVDGLPLTAIVRRGDTARYVSFVYGDCQATSDSGCAPPAEIQVWPAEARNLESYPTSAPGAPTPEPTTIRGLPAAFFDDGDWLEIYTAQVTLVVFSHPRERILRITDAIRCLARSPPDPAPHKMLAC